MVHDRLSDVGRWAWLPAHRVRRWVIALFWVVVLVPMALLGSKLAEVQENDNSAWLPGDAESTQVLERMEVFQSQDVIPALVMYERDGGLTEADLQAIRQQVAGFAGVELVSGDPVGPRPSQDGQAAQVVVPIDPGEDGWEGLAVAVEDLRDVPNDVAGLDRYFTGPAGYAAESAEVFAGIDTRLLGITLLVVVTILLLAYRSPVLWILPVFSALVALQVASGVVYLAARYAGVTVNGQSQSILFVLVLGAGTDYALLLVARYREELRRHENRYEAMAFALHRAGPAILASGATVVAGMLCLLLASLNSTAGLGPVSAIGIVVGLVVMLTLLPALLVIVGRWVFWPKRPSCGSPDPTESGFWGRTGTRIARRPRATWVVTSLVLAVGALGILQLDATGLRQADQYYGEPEPVQGERVLAEHFPAGEGQPVDVVADAGAAREVAETVARVDGIAAVQPPVVREGTAYIAAVLEAGPDSKAAFDTVDRVREAVHAIEGADAQVGGSTAIFDDILEASDRDNRVVIPAILLVVLLILVGLLRALVAPLVLIGTVVLSFFAALGISALLFQYAFGFDTADPSLPLFVFVFLVALGIDYNIFLMTRVHEEAKQIGTRRGALVGLAATGGVITSAGLVLAGTFLSLATLPLVFVAQLGVAVALGVLLDTIIVRAVLVTALNLDLGRLMWWPSALWRQHDPAPELPESPVREPALTR